ncbi:stomatin family protein [Coccidioides immitis RMSCC 3703]|uniref:Stomatin family protein n=1 Tax=Coccidioides immitis RMSCC 3703 TaxID=454286 RepID=A0A0J8QH63_COCIT|nr:stomatin family protein [Coccidioides immitis RMSCC 3703]
MADSFASPDPLSQPFKASRDRWLFVKLDFVAALCAYILRVSRSFCPPHTYFNRIRVSWVHSKSRCTVDMDMENINFGPQSNSKAPAASQEPSHAALKAGAQPGSAGGEIITVQPARLEDLQPSYAQILNHPTQSAAGHGWYAALIHGLGEFLGCLGAIPCCLCCPNPFRPVDQGQVGLALIERTQTTLRQVVGARVLQDVIERREEIAQSIREIIDDVATDWGVKVESMLIKDLIFSDELQESLSMAAQSKRIGESKVIAARAEVEAAKLMRAAADILSSAPAMQIRYLETMQQMAKTSNSKVIFLPAPNQTMAQIQDSLNEAERTGEGPSHYSNPFDTQTNDGFQQAMNARVVEHI